MFGLNNLELLYTGTALLFQIVMIVYFALRKWRFETAIRFGPVVYALSIPAAIVSVILFVGGVEWGFWLGGYIYLVWAFFGYFIDYMKKIEWRSPLRWNVFIPYVFPVSCDRHVLLVAPCKYKYILVVCCHSFVFYQHDAQCHIPQRECSKCLKQNSSAT